MEKIRSSDLCWEERIMSKNKNCDTEKRGMSDRLKFQTIINFAYLQDLQSYTLFSPAWADSCLLLSDDLRRKFMASYKVNKLEEVTEISSSFLNHNCRIFRGCEGAIKWKCFLNVGYVKILEWDFIIIFNVKSF